MWSILKNECVKLKKINKILKNLGSYDKIDRFFFTNWCECSKKAIMMKTKVWILKSELKKKKKTQVYMIK